MIDILVLNYNDSSTTIQFVESVMHYGCVGHILVVDNKSTDDSFEKLQTIQSGKVDVIQSERNGGYGAGNNLGIRWLREKYQSKYILLSNPDVIVEQNVLEKLELFLKGHEDYAIAAPFMLNAKGNRQYNTAFRIPSLTEYICSLEILVSKFVKSFYYKNVEKDLSEVKNVGAVSGSMFLMDAEKMIASGMYDEHIFLYCEEIVLGLKLRKKDLKIALLPQLTFVHNHSVSINKSFRSALAKHKLLMKSKLFVIRNHFGANIFAYSIAFILSRISLLEVWLISLIRGLK